MKNVGFRTSDFGLLVMLIALVAAIMPGCSALQARGDVAAAIDDNAAAAAKHLQTPTTMPAADARSAVSDNAARFKTYADAKTVNWFAYAFGGKQIFVDGVYAELLDRTSLLATQCATAAPTLDEATLNAILVREWQAFIKIKNAKDGKKQ